MKPIVDIAELQEHHLDAMLKLAFDHMDAKEVQQLVDEPDPELTPQEEEMADEIFLMALAKVDKQEKEVRQRKRSSSLKRAFPRIVQVAAAIVLVFAIATPIAFATSAQFRSRVMQLLIEFDYEQGGVYYRFVEDPDASFAVPEGWEGEYFPSYIPDGFSVWNINSIVSSVEFRSDIDPDQETYIFFGEYGENSVGYSGTDNATISYVDIGGSTAQVLEGDMDSLYVVSITWSGDDKWFFVDTYGLEKDEALSIAKSVKKIIR